MSEIVEIRVHGRGGGGVVSAGYMIAVAAFYDNKYSQAFPMFGLERSGSPVTSYVRVSSKPIDLRSQIYEPDYSIVLDSTLIANEKVDAGVTNSIIINSKKPIKKLSPKTFVADASKFGDAFGNVAMVAVFAKCTNLISQPSLLKAVEEIFGRKGQEVVDKNKAIVDRVFKEKTCPLEVRK
ncbi:MAG: 2-oxoacid:acceptor oxidoreductase family protein [Candidatus Nanoarchaeia archaeon]